MTKPFAEYLVASSLRLWRSLVLCLCAVYGPAWGYEADVHYGLTKWLALQAGFPEQQAELIATGNQRVDFGSIETIRLLTDYACLRPDKESAEEMRASHYPVGGADPEGQGVVAGGAAARQRVTAVIKAATSSRAGELLLAFGAALHPFQDSWAHAGAISGPPAALGLPNCQAPLWTTAPLTRGGPERHGADLLHTSPSSALEMAKQTYVLLRSFPAVQGHQRSSKPWVDVENSLITLLKADTKEASAAWFRVEGLNDVSFLAAISLPSGAGNWPLPPKSRILPKFTEPRSLQYDVPEDLKSFFHRFFLRWLTSSDPASAVVENADPAHASQLGARLKLWRLRDHGSASALLHKEGALSKADLRAVESRARTTDAYAAYAVLNDALLPVRGIESYPSPILPYVIRVIPAATEGGNERSAAIAKIRHAPYDEIIVLAEKKSSGWQVVSVQSVVDH